MRTARALGLVAAALVVAAVVGADAARDPTRSSRPRELDKTYDADFDYFVYTMTWPGTFCEEKHCTKEPRYFTVHGLWPNYENGKWPAFCNSSYPFDENEIEDLLPVMNEVRFQFSTQRPHQRLGPLPFFREPDRHETLFAAVARRALEPRRRLVVEPRVGQAWDLCQACA